MKPARILLLLIPLLALVGCVEKYSYQHVSPDVVAPGDDVDASGEADLVLEIVLFDTPPDTPTDTP